jgi:hypothetical protein
MSYDYQAMAKELMGSVVCYEDIYEMDYEMDNLFPSLDIEERVELWKAIDVQFKLLGFL